MFQLTAGGGMNMGTPDVCNTPVAGAPVPTPYPNISSNATANPATCVPTILVDGAPAINLTTEIPLSNGDEAGVQLGVVSGMVMGPTEFIQGSAKLFLKGALAQRLTSQTGHNGLSMNCPGACLAPSQVIVVVLG